MREDSNPDTLQRLTDLLCHQRHVTVSNLPLNPEVYKLRGSAQHQWLNRCSWELGQPALQLCTGSPGSLCRYSEGKRLIPS